MLTLRAARGRFNRYGRECERALILADGNPVFATDYTSQAGRLAQHAQHLAKRYKEQLSSLPTKEDAMK